MLINVSDRDYEKYKTLYRQLAKKKGESITGGH